MKDCNVVAADVVARLDVRRCRTCLGVLEGMAESRYSGPRKSQSSHSSHSEKY